jgi:hypothetical protein
MMGHDGDDSSSSSTTTTSNATGPALRAFYLPGLDHLKLELSCFELLLSSHAPLLHQHLLDAGLPALLYAAQWLMTTYACPFPIHVSRSPCARWPTEWRPAARAVRGTHTTPTPKPTRTLSLNTPTSGGRARAGRAAAV